MPESKKVDGGVDRTYFVPDEDLEKEKVALEKQIVSLQEQITIRQASLTEVNAEIEL